MREGGTERGERVTEQGGGGERGTQKGVREEQSKGCERDRERGERGT